jgi:uncharacterized membrane protein
VALRPGSLRAVSLRLLAAFFVVAGILHFVRPGFYLQIMPPQLPWPLALVYLSGVAEMGLGGALLVPRLRRLAAWGLVALLIAVYPANLYMWWADVHVDGVATPRLFHWIRLPLQVVFVAWAYFHTRPE